MSILFYKRPQYVAKKNGFITACEETGEGTDCGKIAIPSELSFEKVICNKCSPPCSLQDFLNYLIYVAGEAENLQFYLWMVDYYQRFRKAPKADKMRSPKWRGEVHKKTAPRIPDKALANLGEKDMDIYSEDISDASTFQGEQSAFTDEYTQTQDSLGFPMSLVNGKSETSSPHWQQNSPGSQPFRNEIDRIIAHYLLPNSPRILNLTHNDRAAALRALHHTTHPSALQPIKRMLDSTLRNRSHPNFVRWSICNGNKQWVYGLRVFALANMIVGFVIAITLILSHASRYWRILAALVWWFGITNIIAASQGLCVLLHRMHSRQHHVWETAKHPVEEDEAMLLDDDITRTAYENTAAKMPVKMEVFGPPNTFTGERWVSAYERRAWYQKLFEKRIKVQDSGLASIQNKMIRQAEAWALIITVPLTVAFVAIPKGNLF